MELRLTIKSSNATLPPEQTRQVTLTLNTDLDFTIGRDGTADWPIMDPDGVVSRIHCRIVCRDGAFVLIDHSANGVFLNSETTPIHRGERELRNADRISLAHCVFLSVEIILSAEESMGELLERSFSARPKDVEDAENLRRVIEHVSEEALPPASAPAPSPRRRPLPKKAPRVHIDYDSEPGIGHAGEPAGEIIPEDWDGTDKPRDIDCSVYANRQAARGEIICIQAILHCFDERDAADALAALAVEDPEPRGRTGLRVPVGLGDEIEVAVSSSDLIIDDPVQSVIWSGRTVGAQFLARVPKDMAKASTFVCVVVTKGKIPIGRLVFEIGIKDDFISKRSEDGEEFRGQISRYKTAFLSYFSGDRPKVLEYHQIMKALGLTVHQDVSSLTPGGRWSEELYDLIGASDLFMIFWSTAAAKSEWVQREALHALKLQDENPDALPHIYPVLLEGPPPPKPPKALSRIHFNDPIRYLIAHEMRSRGDRKSAAQP